MNIKALRSILGTFLMSSLLLCSCAQNEGEKVVTTGTDTSAGSEKGSAVLLISPADGETEVEIANDLIHSFVGEKYTFKACDKYFDLISDKYMPREIEFSWDGEGNDFTLFLYAGSTDSVPDVYKADGNSMKISGLMGNTDYFWKVASGQGESEVFRFRTAGSPRTVYIDGVTNSRDIGGWKTEDGSRIRQGIVYRTATVDKITPDGIDYCRNVLKIRTELDLRKTNEGKTGVSPLGEDVKYVNISAGCYAGDLSIFSDEYRDAMRDVLKVFADKENYPILFHCSAGRDRTGSLAFILEALCLVSEDDMCREYDLSFFSANGDHEPSLMHTNFFVPTIKGLWSYKGNDYREKAESYMLSLGLTADEIDSIRNNLLEKQ